MKPLTTSGYTFSKFIEGGFLYVDKTAAICELLRPAFAQYFLSRPRRFGKSLLVSTLKAIFQGRRELFKGLYLDAADYDWKTYPVIHLDLGDVEAETEISLKSSLLRFVNEEAQAQGVTLTADTPPAAFRELITQLAGRSGKVVILVDEYDKPLLGHLGQPGVRAIQAALKTFYGVIKKTEAMQRFVLITGVSKFSKVSIFSDLNNLTDLTMRHDAATLLGYTQAELEGNFPDYIAALAAELGKSREATLADLREWYNGYRFEETAETVYNPVSVMKCFQERKFKNYWFETGTPTFLVDLLKRQPVSLGNLDVPETAFSAYEPERLDPLPLLVQTGYLTMADVSIAGRSRQYRLVFPNFEIEESFSYWLARGFAGLPDEDLSGGLRSMVAALTEGRADDMLKDLRAFFANVPNTIAIGHEKYYQTIFYTVFKLIGARIEAEVSTNLGRIDAVVKTRTDIFVFEFKLHDTAEAALAQIREKRYFEPFLSDGRRITLVGVAFDAATRNLGQWLIEAAP